MGARMERKRQLISMRLSKTDIAMIDHAATIRSQSRADFMREAAVRAAQSVLMHYRLMPMSPEGFADFLVSLGGSPTVVPEFVKLARRPAPWE